MAFKIFYVQVPFGTHAQCRSPLYSFLRRREHRLGRSYASRTRKPNASGKASGTESFNLEKGCESFKLEKLASCMSFLAHQAKLPVADSGALLTLLLVGRLWTQILYTHQGEIVGAA